MSPVIKRHPRGMRKVRKMSHTGSKGYSGQHSIPLVPRLAPSRGLWLHHPREERMTERKTICAHSSMSFSNYCVTNHWQGSIGSIWDGVGGGGGVLQRHDRGSPSGREESEDAERQKNNWSIRRDGFCHFENGCQGDTLPPARGSMRQVTSPSFLCSSLPRVSTWSHSESKALICGLQSPTPALSDGHVAVRWADCTYLAHELNKKQRSPLLGWSSLWWLFDWELGALLTEEVDWLMRA